MVVAPTISMKCKSERVLSNIFIAGKRFLCLISPQLKQGALRRNLVTARQVHDTTVAAELIKHLKPNNVLVDTD